MRTIVLFTLAAIVLSGAVSAQNHNQGYLVPGKGHLHYVGPMGSVSSIVYSAYSPSHAAIMNWDNRTALVPNFIRGGGGIMKIDPITLGVVGTFLGDSRFSHNRLCQDMAFDSNGDLFFSASMQLTGIYKIPFGTMTIATVFFNSLNTQPLFWINQMTTDVDTGDLIVGDDNHLSPDTLYLMRRDGLSYSTIGQMGGAYAFRGGCYKHIPTGDIYGGTCCGTGGTGGQSILVLKNGTSVATVFLNDPLLKQGHAPWPDRASAATQQLITPSKLNNGNGIWRVDVGTQTPTKVTTIMRDTFRAMPVFNRNVQSVRTAKGMWDVRVCFPSYPGYSYLLAVGISGVRPGLPLPDGRRLPLAMDTVTIVGLTAGLAPFVKGTFGTLNATGLATANVDLNGLGKAANGLRIFFCAAVLDKNAPLGIAVIGDPKVLVGEGL